MYTAPATTYNIANAAAVSTGSPITGYMTGTPNAAYVTKYEGTAPQAALYTSASYPSVSYPFTTSYQAYQPSQFAQYYQYPQASQAAGTNVTTASAAIAPNVSTMAAQAAQAYPGAYYGQFNPAYGVAPVPGQKAARKKCC